MNIRGIVPLDSKSLLDTAMRETELSDFGADDWCEPFEVYIKALEDEAELNLMGRLRARHSILIALQARLQIEDTYKRHPEIDEEVIREPIMITGLGRTGTSFLQNVLERNPDNMSLLHWEMMFPCPPPEKATYRSDPRIEKADKIIKQWHRLAPEMHSMHEWAATLPFECTVVFAINFMSPSELGIMGQVPSYDAYLAKTDFRLALRYHKRVLKLLQWRNPRQHWVIKDNLYHYHFKEIIDVYPDAKIVWTHRDPVRALASLTNMIGTMYWCGTDNPYKSDALKYVTNPDLQSAHFNDVIAQLEAGVVPPKQIHHLLYHELVGDTMGTIEKMYRHFGMELTDAGRQGMNKYLTENPRDARPPHSFSVGSAESLIRARALYKHYQDYFGIPTE